MTLLNYHATPLQKVRDGFNEHFGWLAKPFEGEETLFDWHPHIDLEELDTHYLVTVDVPGIPPKEVKVDITDNVLTIQGERIKEQNKKGVFERQAGKFFRRIQFPKAVNGQKAEAKGKDGVLAIEVPKEEQTTVRYIEVEEV